MDIRILKYNNYYNRIVKYEKTIDGYMKYVIAATFYANFKPNDGVTAWCVFTYDSALKNKGGDYLIVCDDQGNIDSRWFIMESVRLLNGQYKLTLRRDLIVDNLEILLDAPCFIEKATVSSNSPLIFNSEGFTLNKIKTSETLLKDTSGSAWIVGYTAKGSTMDSPIEYETRILSAYDTLENVINEWNSYKDINGKVRIPKSMHFYWASSTGIELKYKGYSNNLIQIESTNPSNYKELYPGTIKTLTTNGTNAELWDLTVSTVQLATNTDFMKFNNKYVKDGDNYYLITIKATTKYDTTKLLATGALASAMNNAVTFGTPLLDHHSYSIDLYTEYELTQTLVTKATYKIQIENHNDLIDSPYGMFAIPYNAIKLKCGTDPILTLTDEKARSIALSTASAISEQWGGDNAKLYDLQILPYCPFQNSILEDGTVNITNTLNYTPIKTGDNIEGYLLWADTSIMSFTIPYTITVDDPKIVNECDMWRLSSPNYNGQFEFNAAKNGGVSYFNVDCEYKPYSPYIHIAPNFSILYGQDFDDGRGLICSGDFSLTQTSDAFATYQRQNANYDNIFNRQIQNMEFNNNISRQKDVANLLTGTIAGGTSGSLFGGVGGALVGMGLSASVGAYDLALNEAQRTEQLDYTKRIHSLQLGSIQALPNSITKISSLSPDFKLFPVLEYYTCTSEERDFVKKNLEYNGMTVNCIGTIREYLRPEKTYIKGNLIRLEGLDEDTNYITNIGEELNKGVFI